LNIDGGSVSQSNLAGVGSVELSAAAMSALINEALAPVSITAATATVVAFIGDNMHRFTGHWLFWFSHTGLVHGHWFFRIFHVGSVHRY
jgi:hypothetical protein